MSSKEFLESFKQEYNVEHKDNKLILDDELCMVSLGCEYSNIQKYEVDSNERKIIENFCYWLEEYFSICEKSPDRIRKSLNEITKEIKTMKLIDYCLENKVEDRISRKILTEGELRNEYCPTCFIDNIKVLKRRKGGDLQDCVYNDSAKDFGEQCKICWEREMPMIKKRK